MLRFLLLLLFFHSIQINAQTITVRKPYDLLFINCSNELKITIPGLKKEDKLTYEIKGGRYIPGKSAHSINIIPNDSVLELKIFRNKILYNTRKLKAIKLRSPKLKVYLNDSIYDYSKKYYSDSLTNIKIKAFADEWTTSLLPYEVRYSVSEFEIILARGKRLIGSVLYNKDSVTILLFNEARPGDRYVIKINKITRTNSLGEPEITVLEDPVYYSIPLN